MENPLAQQRLRGLPSVEQVAASVPDEPHHLAVAAARSEIAALRERILAGEDVEPAAELLRAAVAERAGRLRALSLRPLLNATGVVLHTNLGRAPLAPEAAEAAARAGAAYTNLELDLRAGARGSRQAHVEGLIRELSGAEAAIAVNNNAAAVLLALAAVAGDGGEVIVGRGQLVEIGGEFRIPDILTHSNAVLVEVGTTNRTRIGDYAEAIGPRTAAILRVHQSNFRTVGFVAEAELAELAELAHARELTLIDDLGSGAIEPLGGEPALRESIAAGADIVCCSADKLLGGPQAGLLAGRAGAIEACRAHPLARAVRIDKLQLAALEATLRLHRDAGARAIPTLAMLAAPEGDLRARAERMVELVGTRARVARAAAKVGGGALPLADLEGPVCLIDPPDGADALVAALREGDPPVIARISEGAVVLDPRTMSDDEAEAAARAAAAAIA